MYYHFDYDIVIQHWEFYDVIRATDLFLDLQVIRPTCQINNFTAINYMIW